MAHARWHTQLPQYGSPEFGSAVSARLRGGASPVRQGLLGTSIPTPAAVGPLKGETEEEKRLRLLMEKAAATKKEKTVTSIGAGVTEGGMQMMQAFGPKPWQPMMNLGMSRQYGGRRGRYA